MRGEVMRFNRTVVAAALATGFILAVVSSQADAQQPAIQATQPSDASGWTFNVAPYLWLPSIDASLNYNVPGQLGSRLPTNIKATPADFLPDLKFAAMFAAEARYGRFSVLTDFMYMSLAMSDSDLRTLDLLGAPSQLALGSSSTLKATIWTLVGGYTVLQEDWGNFDLIAGFRYAGINAHTNFDLSLAATGPNGNSAALGGSSGFSATRDIWDGIAGFRGRVRLADTGLFIPYYFDIGTGVSRLTWQVASGLGYQTGWAGVSLLYRYLAFEEYSSSVVRHLRMGGPMVIVNFSF